MELTKYGEQACGKLAESSRWKDRFQCELREFRITTVRMLTFKKLIGKAVRAGWTGNQIAVLSEVQGIFHDRRLNSMMNLRTSASCAAACDHAARVLFRQEEEGW